MTKKAILIVAHGSTSKNNESAVETQARLLRDKGFDNVYHGFKGYSKPFIQDVVEELAADGFDEIIAVPMFIATGHYTDIVVPKRLGLEPNTTEGTVSVKGRNVHIRMTGVFGTDPRLADIILKRAKEISKGGNRPGILLIGHGSKNPENHDMVKLNAERVGKSCPNVYCSFNEFNEPDVVDALVQMEKDGIDEVLAIPLFVSSGGHTDEDLPEKLGLRQGERHGRKEINGRMLNIRYSDPIGMDPDVSEILASIIKPLL